MTPGRLLRITLVAMGAFLWLVAVAGLSGAIYLSEPYIRVTEVRSTFKPQTVKVRWYLSCEEEHYVDEDNKYYDPQVPTGGQLPGVGPVQSSDTEFVLVGYPYTELRRNILTGSVIERRSERFDVVEWHVVTPYTTLVGDEFIKSTKPLGWKGKESDPQRFTQLERHRKSSCGGGH